MFKVKNLALFHHVKSRQVYFTDEVQYHIFVFQFVQHMTLKTHDSGKENLYNPLKGHICNTVAQITVQLLCRG